MGWPPIDEPGKCKVCHSSKHVAPTCTRCTAAVQLPDGTKQFIQKPSGPSAGVQLPDGRKTFVQKEDQ